MGSGRHPGTWTNKNPKCLKNISLSKSINISIGKPDKKLRFRAGYQGSQRWLRVVYQIRHTDQDVDFQGYTCASVNMLYSVNMATAGTAVKEVRSSSTIGMS